MPKNRLAELKAAQSDQEDDGDQVGDDVIIEMQEFSDQPQQMDKFFEDMEEIRGLLSDLESHVEEVRSKYRTIISSARPDENLKHELDDIMSLVKRTANKVKTKLKILEQNLEENSKDRFNAEYRIQKIQHSALTRKFVDVMTQYNTIQTDYRDKCKRIMQRQLQISGKNLEDEELEEMLEKGNLSVFTEGIILDTQAAKQQLADIEERHADIVKLEKSIKDLHDMFMDMALLISNQGITIDNIEKNVEASTDYVATAREEVVQARQYQWKALKKKVCIIVFLILLLIVILLIIF